MGEAFLGSSTDIWDECNYFMELLNKKKLKKNSG